MVTSFSDPLPRKSGNWVEQLKSRLVFLQNTFLSKQILNGCFNLDTRTLFVLICHVLADVFTEIRVCNKSMTDIKGK